MALEKELKYSLKKKEYEKLARVLRPYRKDTVTQKNFYFDTKKLELRKMRVGLRIRLEGQRATLTAKISHKGADAPSIKAYKVRKEIECRIPLALAKKAISGAKPISEINLPPLREVRRKLSLKRQESLSVFGTIQTKRVFFKLDTWLLELDRFDIKKKRFYELELESQKPKSADLFVHALFATHSIPVRPCRSSKLKRLVVATKKAR